MIREAFQNLFTRAEKPAQEQRFVQFFDNGLGPIRFINDDSDDFLVEKAFAVSAFHACVRVLAESVAMLPFHLMKHARDGTKKRATRHAYYDLLHRRPNSWQSSYEFRETIVQHCCTWGNAYALKVYKAGKLTELWPLHPSLVTPSQLSNNAIVFDYLTAPGGEVKRFRDDQVIHVRYMSDNGYMGMVPMELANGTIELARSMDLYSRKFWQNDARPGVVLETSQPIPPEAVDRLRQQWEHLHRGAENARRTCVLPNGVNVREVSGSSARDSEMIAMRTFIIQEIARAMRVPCSMIGENSRSTFSNSEQEAISFVQNSLLAWCRRLESAFERSLLDGMNGYSVNLDVRGLLRGDSAARSSYYRELFQLGTLSPNDIRRLEDMPPIDAIGADEYYIPTNNMSSISGAEQAPAPTQPPIEELANAE